MLRGSIVLILVTAFFLNLMVELVSGQSAPADLISGQIDLQLEEKKQDKYEIVQEQANQYFKSLYQLAQQFSQGGEGSLSQLTSEERQEIFDYISAVYLYCAARNGKCPLVLDAILESDLFEAKLHSNLDCPNMTIFWGQWRKNDFEKRLSYSLSTGRMVVASDFAREQLPRYLNCKAAVAKELQGSEAATTFFKKRYAGQSERLRDLAKMTRFLEMVKAQVGNVHMAVGAMGR